MKKMLTINLMLLLVFVLIGCAGQCIAVDGAYKGVGAGVKYCWNQQGSEDSGVPTFSVDLGDVGDENSGEPAKTLFGFDLDIITRLKDSLKGMIGMEVKAKWQTPRHPVRELLDLLNTKELQKKKGE